jgi:hypothetical protein
MSNTCCSINLFKGHLVETALDYLNFFRQACQSWLDSEADANYFKSNSENLSRKFLLASQLIVNVALSDAKSRVKRQVIYFCDSAMLGYRHEKEIRYVEGFNVTTFI